MSLVIPAGWPSESKSGDKSDSFVGVIACPRHKLSSLDLLVVAISFVAESSSSVDILVECGWPISKMRMERCMQTRKFPARWDW